MTSARRFAVPRAYLTAIVAELLIQIKERPRDYFAFTDLLDFPGARSRKQYEEPEKFVKKEGSIHELFLRGKVSYLFERYCDDREMPCMILCMQPGNIEVQTLPDMVLNWIRKTHGATPAERAQQNKALFFVFTKFDRRFEISGGTEEMEDQEVGALWSVGRAAIHEGYSVLFVTAPSLVAALAKAHAEGRLDERLGFFAKPKLLMMVFLLAGALVVHRDEIDALRTRNINVGNRITVEGRSHHDRTDLCDAAAAFRSGEDGQS